MISRSGYELREPSQGLFQSRQQCPNEGILGAVSSFIGTVGSVSSKWIQGNQLGMWGKGGSNLSNPGPDPLTEVGVRPMSSQVPYTGVPSVQPSFDATPSVSSNIPVDAFGAGVANAVGHIGKAVEGAGNEIWARATAMQQLNEQANADEAISKFTITQAQKFADFTMLRVRRLSMD